MMKRRRIQDALTAASIDRMADVCVEALTEAQADSRDILRIRLSLEDILGHWLRGLGDGARLLCRTDTRWGRQCMEIRVSGERLDPAQALDADGEPLLFPALLAQASLSLLYEYRDGENCLFLRPPRKARLGQLTQILIALLAALCVGIPAACVPALGERLTAATDPLFDTMLGCLRAISSPMIFLSVCWSIVSIGDMRAVGQIGKGILARVTVHTFAVGGIFALCVAGLFPLAATGSGEGGGFGALYGLLLSVVPSDIVSPFMEGNALQVICMGAAVGIALLALGDRVGVLRAFVEQANALVQYLMELLCRLMPLLIFLSVLSLMLSGALANARGLLQMLLLSLGGCMALCIVEVLALALRFRVNAAQLARKLLPTWLIAVSTASSAAAFATNVETCEKQLGIAARLVNFAIPLGQVLFMPGGIINFLAITLCMAKSCGVAITPVWLVTAVLASGLLAMATTPVPGGALTCYTILFVQLGLPAEALATAIAVDMLTDFFVTATNLTSLQAQTAWAAAKLGLLNQTTLRQKMEV